MSISDLRSYASVLFLETRCSSNYSNFVYALFIIQLLILSTFIFQIPTAFAQTVPTEITNQTLLDNDTVSANKTIPEAQLFPEDIVATLSANQTIPDAQLFPNFGVATEDLVHVLWSDQTPTNSEIFYRRAGGTFDPSVTINLSGNPGSSAFPAIAVAGSNVYAVWMDNSGSTTGSYDIRFRKSTDGGAIFSPAIRISNNAGQSLFPAIAAFGNNVYIVWTDDTPGNHDIFLSRSTDGGTTFGSPINLSNNAGVSAVPTVAAIANPVVPITVVYVAWPDDSLGNFDIWLARGIDSGTSFPFGSPLNLSNDNQLSHSPKVAAAGSNVYIVWNDNPSPGTSAIRFTTSKNAGDTFATTQTLGHGSSPAIAATHNNKIVHVAWSAERVDDIMFRRSSNEGSTFGVPINVSTNLGGSFTPAIATSGSPPGRVYAVWTDDTPGNRDILFRKSSDSGANFEPFTTNLSRNAGFSWNTAIAVMAFR